MGYIVLETFNDRLLGGERRAGTLYPPEGVTVPDEWLAQLAGTGNACGRPFLAMAGEDEADKGWKAKAGEGQEGVKAADKVDKAAKPARGAKGGR